MPIIPTSWFEPIFELQIIYDFGTYFLLAIIFVILHKKKVIELNILILSLVFLFWVI